MKHLHLLVVTLLFIALTACAATSVNTPPTTGGTSGNTDVAAPSPEATQTDAPTATTKTESTTAATATSTSALHNENTLKNLEYTLTALDGGSVTLTNGEYQNSDDMIYVNYISTAAFGDVTGDGSEDALVLIGANTGGSGIFTDLAVVSVDESGNPVNVSTTMLGDRVDVKNVTVEDGNAVIQMVTQGPNEPMCCGTLQVTVTYSWHDGTLTETARTEDGYLNGVENFYNPDTFYNVTINSTVIPSGTITLTDGAYEDKDAQVIAKLDTTKISFGDLNEDAKDEAILLLYSNTGGSGNWTELVVMEGEDGQLVNTATTLLGDRVTVYSMNYTDTHRIVLDMLIQGPNDPQCCPTLHVNAEYALNGDTLEQVSLTELETIPAPGSSGLNSTALNVDITGIADSIEGTLVPYYPTMEGPGLIGVPEHVVYGFNNGEVPSFLWTSEAQIRIFPVADYEAMYEQEGNTAITDYIAALQAQIAGKSTDLPPADMSAPLPFLPVLPAGQVIAANIKYLDFNGGTGYRFITRYAQDIDVFTADSLTYTYQGLTADGKYLIVYIQPLTASMLPATYNEVPQEVFDSIVNDRDAYEAYRQNVITTLNEAPADQFTPNLDALDAMVQSMTVNAE